MADTILILGNGFDLAMGRKTSYKDFLEFADKLFVERDDQLDEFLKKHQIDIEKYRNNLYIQYINENKSTLGENWSNLEIMISQLAEAIDFFRLNSDKLYHESGTLFPLISKSFRKAMSVEDNSTSKIFIGTIFSKLYKKLDWEMLERGLAISKLNNEFIRHLELLTELLEIYLTYVEEFGINPDKFQQTALNAISDIENSYVINFNYTHTLNELFNIPIEKTHFIHGEINLKRHDYEINTMVFGIEDKGNEINNGLIPYQKFYQRIVKETGNMYEKFFTDRSKDIWGSKPLLNIVVFGHSVDPLDKEIFRKCFDLLKDSSDYRFIFTYYDDPTKRSIIKNLAIILGKDRLVELTGHRKVVFVKSEDVGGMRELLLK
ncbi:AbiH family protein [uncultured Streptococcus sp.]|uniref:AbiH family protein n=1 Tax=uncultured Streptococcus sp. TaxID=83427 RepID=UPI0025F72BE9|nr:AbiH family protein [uncultured Streptococcus sp.]